MHIAKGRFKDILKDNLDDIKETLADVQSKFDDLLKPINNIYDKISGSLYDYSAIAAVEDVGANL